MANTVKMLDHRHLGFIGNFGGEAFAATRDDHINHAAHAEHFGDGSTIRGGDELHTIYRQMRSLQPEHDAGVNGLIAVQRFRPTA